MSVPSLKARARPSFALLLSTLALSGFVSGRALGAGTIQSLSASPNPALPGQPVTFKIAGTGEGCLALLVFGDGQQQAITIKGIEGTATHHAYPAAGTFTPHVTGKPPAAGDPPSAFRACDGSAEMRLVVAAKPGSPTGGPPPTRTPTPSAKTKTPPPSTLTQPASTRTPTPTRTPPPPTRTAPPPTRTPTPTRTPPPSIQPPPPPVITPQGGGTSGSAAAGAAALGGTAARALARPTVTPNPMLNPGGDTMFSQVAFNQIANPHLDRVTDGSQATPGGVIGVEGSGFGTWIPNRRLILKTGGKEVDLKIQNWGDKAAAGAVPDDFGGVPDGAATVQLVNGIKKSSNELPLSFVAGRVTIEVIKRPVIIRGCYAGLWSRCNAWDSDNSGGVQNLDSAPSVEVYHGCTHWDFFHSGDDGGDLFEIQLKNGWVFENATYDILCGSGDLNYSDPCYYMKLNTFNVAGKGTPTGSVRTSWHIPRMYAGQYAVHMLATGPAGIPYN